MNRLRTPVRVRALAVAFAMLTSVAPAAVAQSAGRPDLGAIDALLSKAYTPDQPGAAVTVTRDGKTIFRKAYGLANLELRVPLEPDMVLRVGSITKQFTAAAIVLLAEDGKLALEDDVRKHLPDYAPGGPAITIEQLLNHTSGIPSYTGNPAWRALWRKDLSTTELVGLFKDLPLEFAPGTDWKYNNSAYALAGAIIEKISGQSYAAFLKARIFDPLGMSHTFYDVTEQVIPGRASGYTKPGDVWRNAAYLSMTHPFAAGALASTVDDLARWDAALTSGRVLKPESLRRAWTSAQLKDGRPVGYGLGWIVSNRDGVETIAHGGSINGFGSYAIRLPREKIFVAILANSDSGRTAPEDLAKRIAVFAQGRAWQDPAAVSLSAAVLDAHAGVYAVNGEPAIRIAREGNGLVVHLKGGRQFELTALSPTEFLVKADPSMRYVFTKDAAGATIGLEVRGRQGPPSIAQRTDRPMP